MAKSKSWEIWAAVLIIGIIVLYSTGHLGTLSVATPTNGVTTPQSGSFATSCNPTPKVQLTVEYYNASANNGAGGFTQVATPYNAFISGKTSVYASGSTSATAVTNVTATCNQAYNFVFGDNSGVYVNGTTYSTSTSPLQGVTLVSEKIATPTLKFKNATSAGYTTGGGLVDDVSNNQVLSGGSQISIQVAATGSGACFGNPNYAIQFSYKSGTVSSIQLPGFSTVSQTLPSESTFASGSSQTAFQIPGPLCNYQTQVLNPTINLATVPTGAANSANTATAVGVYLIPETNLLYNGALLSGYYVTPGTTTALGTVTSSSAGIAFGTT